MLSKICLLLFVSSVLTRSQTPCNRLDTSYGHVCVCDSSYCDTINLPKRLQPGQFHFYYTSKESPGFNHDSGHFQEKLSSTYGFKFAVNASKTFQTIRGFGGAFTDLFGSAFNTLPHRAQEKLIKSFFSEEGIEYSVCRIVLGSSDFSLRDYTYLPHYDPTLKSFNLTKDDYIYKISQIKWALSTTKRPINFLGSTWTSPPWMKTNNVMTTGFLKPEFRQLWADYYIKTLDAFKKEGIEFWGLTAGNEPLTLYSVKTLPNLAIFPEEQREWIVNNLGPSLKNSGYDLKLIFLDDMRMYVTWWMNEIMREPRIKEYSTGVGLHWYTDAVSDPNVLTSLHEKYPELEIIYTESSINLILGNFSNALNEMKKGKNKYNVINLVPNDAGIPKLGSWKRAAMYAENIIENLNHWVTSYIDWNLALNMMGGPNLLNSSCDASIIIDEDKHIFYKQPIYYVMGHFSKFMAPGSVVIDVHNSTELYQLKSDNVKKSEPWHYLPNYRVQYVGVLNRDGSHAITFYNPKPFAVKISVYDPRRGYAELVLQGDSISTLIYW